MTTLALGVATAAGLVALTTGGADAHPTPRKPKPTVVLVHGAWADSSSWDGVVGRLQSDGYEVDVFPTPLRSLTDDAAYLRVYLTAISGPIVLVGHSYGGAVITDAATGNGNVKELVYIDAFAPDEGQAVNQLVGATSVVANPDPTKVFSFVPATSPNPDLYVLPSVFVSSVANDLPARQARVLAATQRPIAADALKTASTTPAWRSIPSWYEVGTIDKVIPPEAQLAMAATAHSHVVKVRSSHLPMISQPKAVTRTIEAAAASLD
ncbi:alpha/beta fold hydrolase [Jatrophihabitans sp. GAS493]|uniref:alpha/beta fold hydrolase n=1 Tax=Jatrophihabitans sp. GAS493 TaxID=1907575 RepID=UPI001F53C1CB|nr:alpha/beta hydrolase [Jatrophihabitans sp. GAS493]